MKLLAGQFRRDETYLNAQEIEGTGNHALRIMSPQFPPMQSLLLLSRAKR